MRERQVGEERTGGASRRALVAGGNAQRCDALRAGGLLRTGLPGAEPRPAEPGA